MTPEGKVKAQVKKILDERGVYYFCPATGGYGRSGVPDFICCYNGMFMAIECKAGKGDLTALQTRELTRIHAAGGEAVVVRETSMGNFINFLGSFK